MKISYVTTSNEGIASYRYRIACPALMLRNYGWQTDIDRKANPEADIVVFSKHWQLNDASYAKFCSLRGQKVVYDICDNHFHSEKYRDHYYRMVDVADLVTCNSIEMREIILAKTDRVAVVIDDPVLSERRPYKKGEPSLVWYGSSMNIQGLYDVYTPDIHTPLEVISDGRVPEPPENFRVLPVTWQEWNPWAVTEAVDRGATMALLPYRQGRSGKSANRVLEALWSGMPVITDLVSCVNELEAPEYVIQYIENGIALAVQNYLDYDLTNEMQGMQDYIEGRFSPENVGKVWKQTMENLCG